MRNRFLALGSRIGRDNHVVPFFQAGLRNYSEATGVTQALVGETDVLSIRSVFGELFFDGVADANQRNKLKNVDGLVDFALTNKAQITGTIGGMSFSDPNVLGGSTVYTQYDTILRTRIDAGGLSWTVFRRYGINSALSMVNLFISGQSVTTIGCRVKTPVPSTVTVSFGVNYLLTLGEWYFSRVTMDSINNLYQVRIYNSNGILVSTTNPTVVPPNGSTSLVGSQSSTLNSMTTVAAADQIFLSHIWEKKTGLFNDEELRSIFAVGI